MRINRYLASCGIASRRKCEELITSNKVKINNHLATLSSVVSDTDVVTVNGRPVKPSGNNIYIILNKPSGVMTTCYDPQGRKTVLDYIKKSDQKGERIYPVGRLDYETEGLLILTNDGDFARRLTHPTTKVVKTYIATIDKAMISSHIRQLEQGVDIDGEVTHPAKAKLLDEMTIELKITQGRNRQVRKMFEVLGYKVTRLKRTQIGALTLGDLKRGTYRVTVTPPL